MVNEPFKERRQFPRDPSARVQKLYEVMHSLQQITTINDLERLLNIIMRSSKKTMEAEASSLLLLDEETEELYFHQTRGGSDKVNDIRVKMGQGIAGIVAQSGKGMIVNDVSKSNIFLTRVDAETGFTTRQIICAPLMVRNSPIGVLQAINRVSEEPYGEEDLALFNIFASQAAVAIENTRLFNLATYDGLTQIFNRRYYEEWFSKEFSRIEHSRRDLSLMLIDLDHFKKVNDTYGHPAGDYVLRTVSHILKTSIGNSDVPARYGGEELIVVMPDTPPEAAMDKAERVRKAVESYSFVFDGKTIPVTMSVGVSSLRHGSGQTEGRMVQEADLALYEAKKTRNRSVFFIEKAAPERAAA